MLTIEEFQDKFNEIKNQNWIPSVRRGPTGIGQTLEQLLGLTENNIALPDLREVELKSHRIGSTSMVTLFTFNRKVWKMKPIEAIRRYGTPDTNGRMGVYFTMSPTPNSTGLFLYNEEHSISVRHISGEVITEWSLDDLKERFYKKISGLVLVSAFSEMRGSIEWFQFSRAQLLTDTSPEIIREQILAGNVLIDLRLHDKGTSARNHGTGFRVKKNKLSFLFKNVGEL